MIAVLTLLAAAPAFAAEVSVGADVGATKSSVRAKLVEFGYDVRKIETDDGLFEAYAVQGRRMQEIFVDPKTGKVVRIESK